MRIAIPLSAGQLAEHFGHCEQFLFVDADLEQREVLHKTVATAPEHAPGLLPRWLAEHGVDIVIAGGLGARACDLLSANAVQVLTGVSAAEPDVLIASFLNGTLQTGDSRCDHSAHGCSH
jgi:ATP-binding protein involved in chromosome partitioning